MWKDTFSKMEIWFWSLLCSLDTCLGSWQLPRGQGVYSTRDTSLAAERWLSWSLFSPTSSFPALSSLFTSYNTTSSPSTAVSEQLEHFLCCATVGLKDTWAWKEQSCQRPVPAPIPLQVRGWQLHLLTSAGKEVWPNGPMAILHPVSITGTVTDGRDSAKVCEGSIWQIVGLLARFQAFLEKFREFLYSPMEEMATSCSFERCLEKFDSSKVGYYWC